MGLAVLGSGMIVQDFLSIASDLPEFDLAAIFGNQRDVLEGLSETYGIRAVYTDYEECLADPAVEAVYVGLPNSLHFGFARRALLAGKHVICEKPFTLNLEELRELRVIASERGLMLIEAITTQYLTNYRLIKEALPTLGALKLIQCNYSQYSSRYPAFRRGEVLPAFDPALGGGALMDIGIYNIHFVVGLLGKPVSVTYSANIERGVDTSGVLVLEYPTCRVVCVGAKDCGGPVQSLVQGDGGTIVLDGPPNLCDSFTVMRTGEDPLRVDEKVHPHRMVEEFRAFALMVRTSDTAGRDERLSHSEAVLEVAARALDSAGIRLGV
ncbi:NAD(P)-dependent oxidoreductase [Cryobacterium arcticum]|uniref:NAD(P)-dependent oxidoreductase n=1 Tax=Cryobacterium arcticum TaxID=670052 RepID=A0A317ZX86_9MICO|nr:NAD(P)-dependent oxidoreductase [Cryobacterium arcticum]